MPAGNGNAEAAAKKASLRRRTQAGQPVATPAGAPPAGESEGGPAAASAPLSAVVSNAVRRWFVDTHKEAIRGDVVRTSLKFFFFHYASPSTAVSNTARCC